MRSLARVGLVAPRSSDFWQADRLNIVEFTDAEDVGTIGLSGARRWNEQKRLAVSTQSRGGLCDVGRLAWSDAPNK